MRTLICSLGILVLGCVRMTEQADSYACGAEDECPPGQACIADMNETSDDLGGLCGVGGTDCASHDDCAPGAKCVGYDKPTSDAPGIFGACELPRIGVSCSAEEDCRSDETCVMLTHQCTTKDRPCRVDDDCVEAQACGPAQTCVSMTCRREADCFPYTCRGGLLGCTTRCTLHSDCALSARCDFDTKECVF